MVRRDRATLLVGQRPGLAGPDEPGLVEVLRLLDGRRVETLGPLAAERAPTFGGDLPGLLRRLAAGGVLIEAGEPLRRHLCLSVHRREESLLGAAIESAVEALPRRDDENAEAVAVLVSCGPLPRAWLSRALAQGLTVLPVAATPAGVEIGPLTVPGATPCLECADHEAERWDPAWPVVLSQLQRPLVRAAAPIPPPASAWRAAGCVVEQLETWATPDRASTPAVGAVLTVTGTGLERRGVGFHHRCPCSRLRVA